MNVHSMIRQHIKMFQADSGSLHVQRLQPLTVSNDNLTGQPRLEGRMAARAAWHVVRPLTLSINPSATDRMNLNTTPM